MKKIILIISVISIFPLYTIAQKQQTDQEENYNTPHMLYQKYKWLSYLLKFN